MEAILIVAFLTEAIWETIKMVKKPKGISLSRLGVMLFGVLMSLAAGIDIFKAVGVNLSIKYLGCILTGLLISRGSNLIHDLLGSISNVYQKNKTIV